MIVFCDTSRQGSVVAKPYGKRGVLCRVSIKTEQTASLECSDFFCYVHMGLWHVALFRYDSESQRVGGSLLNYKGENKIEAGE